MAGEEWDLNYLGNLQELSRFQRYSDPSLEELFAFLSLSTFAAFPVEALFLAVLRANGAIHFPAKHGKNVAKFVNTPERVLDTQTPGRAAFIEDKVVECGSFDVYPFYYPQHIRLIFPNGFQASLAIPVPAYGALMLYSLAAITLDSELENFLRIVGEILALHFDAKGYRPKFDRVEVAEDPSVLLALTARQWAIHEAMLRGLPNAAIAKELSYSESLIRQETMRIYSKLGIRGRRDLPIPRGAIKMELLP